MEATQEENTYDDLTPLELLEIGQIKTLEQLFIATDTNFTNLWERLGLKTPYKLTRIKNNPKDECSFETLKDISQITGIKATLLLRYLKVGANTVVWSQVEELQLEEIITPA